MSTTTFLGLNLPKELPYVGVALASTLYLMLYQAHNVVQARTKAGVKYPRVYADFDEAEKSIDKMRFNCYQRAHQNTLESLPLIYVGTILTGLKHPIFAAGACGLWVFTRFVYTARYGSGKPEKRALSARAGYMILLALIASSTYVSVQSALSIV
ncbi:hypothetical protein VKT23_020658 [Stygiomarasmius scandens]|uniref:Microsomal glutathione S-transferase 3 n=1 Tax=Marasmiellus scandens TaxID=2682957 RepID=A0ABR1IIM6_9AGAR